MQTEVGIFRSVTDAEAVVAELLKVGIPNQSITFLTGFADDKKLSDLRTTDAEPDGMGKTMGALLGGAAGAGAGLSIGTAAASLIVPGVGPIMAAGLGAAAALGLGGAALGGGLGDSTEHKLDEGVPRDDVTVYRTLLKEGKTLVLVSAESAQQATVARLAMQQGGTEDIAEARKQLHDAA